MTRWTSAAPRSPTLWPSLRACHERTLRAERTTDYSAADQVPYIGRSSLHELILVATGFRKWGLSNGAAAAIILSDLLAGRDNPWLPVFDASRIGDAKTAATLIKDNLKVGKEFVGGHIDRLTAEHGRELAPGHGGMIDIAMRSAV